VKTDIGTFSVGRISSDIDSAGLQTLGYAPGWGIGTSHLIFDQDSDMDGAMYLYSSDVFGLKAFYAKRGTVQTGVNEWHKDADWDRFSIEPFWRWDDGGASVALQFDSDRTIKADGRDSLRFFTINPAFMQSFRVGEEALLTLHGEAKIAWGRRGYLPGTPGTADSNFERKITGAGAYLDLALDYGSGDATLAGWWMDGADRTEGDNPLHLNEKSLVDPGDGFYPFMIMYRVYGQQIPGSKSLEARNLPGHWALALLGKHEVNDWLTLTYGLGNFRRTGDYTLANGRSVSKAMGFEANAGVIVQLLDNVAWTSTLGLFVPGSYYEDRYAPGVSGAGLDRKIIGWGNELMFTF
jgi:hypothetical protein